MTCIDFIIQVLKLVKTLNLFIDVIYQQEARPAAAHINYSVNLRSILSMLKHAKSFDSIAI